MNFEGIGKKIQVAREERKMSQEQLANAIGCSQSALSNYEKGKRRIYLSQLERLSEVLEKPMSYFAEGFEENKNELSLPYSRDNFILNIINEMYTLTEAEIIEVNNYIQYLIWKRGVE